MLAKIQWEDSRFLFGWNDLEEFSHEPAIIETVGHVLDNNDHCIVIASSISKTSNQAGNPTIIPKSAILSYEDINV